jgi:hypothetical protein
VFFHRSIRRHLPAILTLCGLVLFLPGCPLSPDDDPGDDPGPTNLREPSTPAYVVERLAQVWSFQIYDELAKLLHEGYRFYPLDTDADQMPWLVGDFWGRTDELNFASNMFDDNFSGAQPAVDSIDWTFSILSQRETTDATYGPVTEVTATAVITVLTAPDEGFSSDTKFIFLMIKGAYPGQPSWYQILEQREVPRQS